MSNLPKFIALEKLVQTVGHGRIDLELQLRAGEIVGVTTTGSKRTLYNSSDKDTNNNQAALEYIIKRISQQLESKVQSELVFKVDTNFDKIRSVTAESKQTIK
ncbi:MAG: hypothetical protein HY865_22555 [Chloroflexi bacterium]|nr:hypothetical protein [Chloroflexota bacterium]